LSFSTRAFARYRKDQFAPLGVSLQYLRDSTITRFFRSTIDKGTFGIVQRLDENGNPDRRIWKSSRRSGDRSFHVHA
jgi:hypothetical protein